MTLSRRQFSAALLGSTALLNLNTGWARAPRRKPNVITIVLDDVGYSDLGCFGSEIHTPNMNALAAGGLRYVHFDTKAICSPTRASLLTGRNCHTVNMPDVPDLAAQVPANQLPPGAFQIPRNAETLAQVLQKAGYATWALGKWHLNPVTELGPGKPRDHWPLQLGFDYFYGFPRGWTDQYRPELVENNEYIKPALPADYHLSKDLVDKAIDLIERNGAKPFYLNLAFGCAHAPIQVPRAYSRKYDAVYAAGWDRLREQRLPRMKRMGIVPENTLLPPRNPGDRAWDALSDDEKGVFARFMAVYAGFIEHCDEQIGRLLAHLKARGLEEDTLIVLISDNGAASEAGQKGDFEALYRPNTLSPAQQHARIDELGTAKTQAEYPRPWAMASVTPLRRYKLYPYAGGTRTPMIVRWPRQIADRGALRRQFVDVIDIAPTIVEAAGARFAEAINGVAQIPVGGQSFAATFSSRSGGGRDVQFFELRGNRAITAGTWRAVASHECGKPYAEDRWELFDLSRDFSEANDLSATYPQKLAELKDLWSAEWSRFSPVPLRQPLPMICTVTKRYDET